MGNGRIRGGFASWEQVGEVTNICIMPFSMNAPHAHRGCFVSHALEALVKGTKQEKEHSDTDRCPAGDNAKAAERSTCSSWYEEAENRMSRSSLFPDLRPEAMGSSEQLGTPP